MSWISRKKVKIAVLFFALLGIGILSLEIGPIAIYTFNRIYLQSKVVRNTYWFGIPTEQTPTDMWMMQEIITEVKPDFIVETGTYLGGSALFFATVLEHVNLEGKVITVDIADFRRKGYDASRILLFRERVEFVKGNSVSPEVIKKIAEEVKGHRVMVLLDSNHRQEHVLKELELYSPLVSVGSYIIVHDTNRRGKGPFEAVREFLAKYKNFEIDRSKEKFFLTYSPSGYLKRIG
jgi:cephalosporin hydroxylase